MLYYQVPGLALWMAIFLCLVIPRENRNRRAWMILVPMVAAFVIWGMLRQVVGVASNSDAAVFDQIVAAVALATAVLWLLSGRLVLLRGVAVFFASLLILMAVGALSTWSFGAFSSFDQAMQLLVVHTIWVFVFVTALTITRFFCREWLTGRRFGFAMFVSTVILFTLTTFAVVALIWMLQSYYSVTAIIAVLFTGGVVGVISYLLAVPYFVIAFKSRFYRARMLGCLGLSEPAEEEAAGFDAQEKLP